ncbi:hypothetical protein BGX27_008168 [Mortierella sp. AM989]|nr:hypothetical protein BGX27_008168 [Mortierella sp. AM989]
MSELALEAGFQSFRALLADNHTLGRSATLSSTLKITLRPDSKTGKNVILWDDVTIAFRNATRILNGDMVMVPLRDEDFQLLEPIRYAPVAGVTLDVMIEPNEYCGSDISDLRSEISSYTQGSQIHERNSTGQDHGSSSHRFFYSAEELDDLPQSSTQNANSGSDTRSPFSGNPEGPQYHINNSRGGDYDLVPELFRNAEQGHTNAQFKLAEMYERGDPFDMNAGKAAEWYLKSANLGNTNAQRKMGTMYKRGHGVTENYTEARRWFKAAADQGDVQAQVELGFMIKNGQGGPKDLGVAIEHWGKALFASHF